MRPVNELALVRWLISAAWLGLGLRLILALGLDVTPTSDSGWYHARALEMLDTGQYAENGIPTAYWPVGYPAFLAAVMGVFGRSVLACKLANVLLSGLCLWLVYRWSRQRWPDQPLAAAGAVTLLALYPNQIAHSGILLTEPLFTALLLGMCVVAGAGRSVWHVVGAGLLAGIATLVKTQTLLLAPVLLLLLWTSRWRFADLRTATGLVVVATAAMLLTIGPWTWRNHQVFGAFIPVSTNGGMSLLSGNNPSMTLDLRNEFAEDDDLVRSVRFSVADQVAADHRARAAAWNWMRENPGRFIALMPKKFLRLWLWDGEAEWAYQRGYASYDDRQFAFRAVRGINQLYYFAAILILVGIGFRGHDWRDPAQWQVPLMLAYFSMLCLVFSGQSRYHAPLMPFVFAIVAHALVRWRSVRRGAVR